MPAEKAQYKLFIIIIKSTLLLFPQDMDEGVTSVTSVGTPWNNVLKNFREVVKKFTSTLE